MYGNWQARQKGDRGERKDDGWIFWVYTPALSLSPTAWPQAGHLTSLGLSPIKKIKHFIRKGFNQIVYEKHCELKCLLSKI